MRILPENNFVESSPCYKNAVSMKEIYRNVTLICFYSNHNNKLPYSLNN